MLITPTDPTPVTDARLHASDDEPLVRALLGSNDVLGCFHRALRREGYAGDTTVPELLYLAATTRLFAKPVSVAIKAEASSGKSFAVDTVLEHLPASAYHKLTAMSDKALAYSDVDLRHRVLVITEAAGISGEWATYFVRSLLSEGRVHYEYTDFEQRGTTTIDREGPTGLFVTTTRLALQHDLETRILSVSVDDTPDQTREVMLAEARDRPTKPDYEPWRTFQEELGRRGDGVCIPFAEVLAEEVDPAAVRLRRDFPALLSLIRAHALLHGARRERAEDGRLVAVLEDYAAVYERVADLITEGAGRSVPDTVRETVDAVEALDPNMSGVVRIPALADKLGLDVSATRRRVYKALSLGYLRDLKPGKGRHHELQVSDRMPEERAILPRPADLREACNRARQKRAA